jgi:hypothetical protein
MKHEQRSRVQAKLLYSADNVKPPMPTLDDDLDRVLLDALKTGELERFEPGERPMPDDAVWKKPAIEDGIAPNQRLKKTISVRDKSEKPAGTKAARVKDQI